MKYLKHKIINESDYFQDISHSEYLDLLNNKPKLDFDIIYRRTKEKTPITMKDIGMSLSSYGVNELKEIRKVSKSIGLYFEESNFHLSDKIELLDKSNKVILVIYKLDDEWYLITSVKDLKFYKCDQLDGLIEFLKSRKVNESKVESDLWRRIDGYFEYEDKMNLRTKETFNESEFKFISNLVSQYNINYKRGPLTTLNTNGFCIRIHGVSTNPEITKSGDEYYYIEIPETRTRASIYYECDGLEGLEEMLDKILKSYKKIDREKDEIMKSIISKLDSKSKEELLELKNKLNESFSNTYFRRIDKSTFMREIGSSEIDWDLDCMLARDIEYILEIYVIL